MNDRRLDQLRLAENESRRRFVRNVGVGGAAVLGATAVPALTLAPGALAQAGSGGGGTSTGDIDIPTTDQGVVEFAVGLELAFEAAYELALDTPLLAREPQSAEMARTFAQHHRQHALTLGELIGHDEEDIGPPNQELLDELTAAVQQSTSSAQLLQVLFDLEQSAAATYADALLLLESQATAGPVAAILPVESQHATALGRSLDLPVEEWMPPFQTTDGAYDPATYAG